MLMNRDMCERAARQGLRSIGIRARCPNCNYIAETSKEKHILLRRNSPCPKCGIIGRTARVAPSNYLDVANWIGEYAVAKNRRDQASAVILFCALVESILETLKDDYLALHPKTKTKVNKRSDFTGVFGVKLGDLLSAAPDKLKQFPSEWKELREKRNKFLHGKSSSYHIHEADAYKAMDLALVAIRVYVWLNNRYCLKI